MLRDVFDALVAASGERAIPRATRRDAALAAMPGKADALVGMRRVGKTWRMYQHMAELIDRGVERRQLLYVNLEDERLTLAASDLSELMGAWYSRYPDIVGRDHWLFLDEVQNVPGWERFVRRMLDQGDVHVLVTGSSSKMLSAEIATTLRGRALTTEILPFSFAEALAHAAHPTPTVWPPGPAARAHLVHAFDRYFETGGFPEVVAADAELRRRVLQEYVDVAILRDIVERHALTQVAPLRWLVRRLLSHPSGRFTANALHRDLRSQGFTVGKDTVHALLAHIEDAHLVYTLPLWTPSASRRGTNPRKAYAVDPALSRTAAFAKPADVGHWLENLVYLELRRRGVAELGYVLTAGGREVDFCVRTAGGALALVQVCADLTDADTLGREMGSLNEAMAELGVHDATLVTLREEGHATVPAGNVAMVPAWRWLLQR